MTVVTPYFLLLADTEEGRNESRWRFTLQDSDGEVVMEADDVESRISAERLALLTIVRGLEALEQPSRVTVVTSSGYVSRGITLGIDQWKENDWTWEAFGKRVPIKHVDLWRRLDNALRFHQVNCRQWRFDRSHAPKTETIDAVTLATAAVIEPAAGAPEIVRRKVTRLSRRPSRVLWSKARRGLRNWVESLGVRFAQLGSGIVPKPWLE